MQRSTLVLLKVVSSRASPAINKMLPIESYPCVPCLKLQLHSEVKHLLCAGHAELNVGVSVHQCEAGGEEAVVSGATDLHTSGQRS